MEGDCLNIMRTMPSKSVRLIYTDPPFNTGRSHGEFDDRWHKRQIDTAGLPDAIGGLMEVVRRAHDKATSNFVAYMAYRIVEMHRLLKDGGSLYYHCDHKTSHYMKIALDILFGSDNFRNEIVWRTGWVSGYKATSSAWMRNHDIILYYAKGKGFTFNKQYLKYRPEYINKAFTRTDEDGRRYRQRENRRYYEDDGGPNSGKGTPMEDTWNCSCLDELDSILFKSNIGEYEGYPTQKPIALASRIILASSNDGDVVLDPFCGSGTTLVAASALSRRRIGIDINPNAAALARKRLRAMEAPLLAGVAE